MLKYVERIGVGGGGGGAWEKGGSRSLDSRTLDRPLSGGGGVDPDRVPPTPIPAIHKGKIKSTCHQRKHGESNPTKRCISRPLSSAITADRKEREATHCNVENEATQMWNLLGNRVYGSPGRPRAFSLKKQRNWTCGPEDAPSRRICCADIILSERYGSSNDARRGAEMRMPKSTACAITHITYRVIFGY